jgi:hypothetical protein
VAHQLADVGVLKVGQASSVPSATIISCQEKKTKFHIMLEKVIIFIVKVPRYLFRTIGLP